MKKLIFFFILFCSFPCFGQSLEEMISDPEKFDGEMVSFEAEVIGEALFNAGGIWLNVYDQGYNLGIYLNDKKEADKIQHFGSYREKGDRVRISGIFYDQCPEHHEQGLHVRDLEVVSFGYRRKETVSGNKKKLSLVLAIICLTLGGIYLIKEHYGKRDQSFTGKG